EDLHWSDEPTLTFINRFLGRSEFVRMCLIVTARPHPRSSEVAAVIDALGRAGASTICLPPLPPHAARELALHLLKASQIGEGLREQLDRTGGNPLFVAELMAGLRDQDLLVESGPAVDVLATALPSSLRLTILRRLATLGEPVVSWLKRAAVLGRRFSVADVLSLSHLEPSELLEHLDVARRADIVQHYEGDLGFRHDVIRDALYDDIPESARRTLHMEASRVLAARGAPAVEVAGQIVRGVHPGDVEAASRLRAAATKLRSTAPRDAIRLLELALDTVPDHPERGALEEELAEACMWAGQPIRAEELARKALRHGGVTSAASITLMRAVVQQNRPEHTVATIDELIEGPKIRTSEARIHAEAAQGLSTSTTHHDRAKAAAERAIELARSDDRSATVVAEMTLGYLANYHGYLSDAAKHTARALEAASSDPTEEGLRRAPHLAHGFHLNLLGRTAEAELMRREGVAVAERLGTEWVMPSYHTFGALISYVQGRYDEAETEFKAGIGLAQGLGVSVQLVAMYVHLAELLIDRGRVEAARGLLNEGGFHWVLAEAIQLPDPFARWAGGRLLDEAEGRLDDLTARAAATVELIEEIDYLLVYRPYGLELVRGLAGGGRQDEAQLVVKRLDWLVDQGDHPTARGDAACAFGVLHDDPDAVLAGIDHYRAATAPVRLAHGLVDAGRMLRHRDQGRAAEALQEAAELYEKMGAHRRLDGCLAMLREVGVRRGARGTRKRPRVGWEALTQSELRIALMVADGLSNPEIAQRLFVSRRTVEGHLAHTFAKLDLTSRTQLTAEVIKRRL
ncbi:MAG TPA: LuxR C-terminal-related transcriptional regulator, partial [Thermomicrobiales bacterium]|nr:LuxR C-terminal-related transcriptional regulator [Thermomicrobiales bacterium]